MMAEKEQQYSLAKDAFNRLIANKLAIIGLVVIALLVLVAAFGPLLTPYDFLSQDLTARNAAPSAQHWFGTDDLGRDVLSRVVYGARTAVIVAFSVTILSFIIGTALGAVGGYMGGKVDASSLADRHHHVHPVAAAGHRHQRVPEAAASELDGPPVPGDHNEFWRNTVWVDFAIVFGSLALIKWPKAARLIRGQILSIRNKNYVVAAGPLACRRLGYSCPT
jgi:peptide/nickel transport system permease protein